MRQQQGGEGLLLPLLRDCSGSSACFFQLIQLFTAKKRFDFSFLLIKSNRWFQSSGRYLSFLYDNVNIVQNVLEGSYR